MEVLDIMKIDQQQSDVLDMSQHIRSRSKAFDQKSAMNQSANVVQRTTTQQNQNPKQLDFNSMLNKQVKVEQKFIVTSGSVLDRNQIDLDSMNSPGE